MAAMLFGWRVVKHVKSNAIVYCGPDRTLGIGAGQMSRVDSIKIAVWKAGEANLSLAGSVVCSDAFFPFADGLLAAAEAGADVIHGTALGIGERAGNAPLDQTLVNLSLMGVIDNDLTLLNEYMLKAHEYVEVALPRNYPVFGGDAFETGTGVHASAVIKAMKKGDHWLADRIYSGVPAGDYGLQQKIRVGHMSGRSNIVWWLKENGYEQTDELVEHMFEIAKNQRRLMPDEDVKAAVEEFLNA